MSEATEAIVVREAAIMRVTPRQIIEQATEEAEVLASVIDGQQLYSMIQGKKFVKVEGWVTLATLRGMLPREVSVTEMPEGRYVAEVELVRMSDGMVLTKASAECGGPEDYVWQKRPPNARRSMAITRATGKACRVAFSWVMALSGFEVTPLEEMPTEDIEPPRNSDNSAVRAAAKAADIPPLLGRSGPPLSHHNPVLTFGFNKGKRLSEIDNKDLMGLISFLEKQIADPANTFKSQNKQLMDSCLVEKQRRAANAEPPHPADEDIPF